MNYVLIVKPFLTTLINTPCKLSTGSGPILIWIPLLKNSGFHPEFSITANSLIIFQLFTKSHFFIYNKRQSFQWWKP